jgi:hypothetical protein
MVKLFSGSLMVAFDAVACAHHYTSDGSAAMLLGAACLSALGAAPFVAHCAEAWFNSFSAPRRVEN